MIILSDKIKNHKVLVKSFRPIVESVKNWRFYVIILASLLATSYVSEDQLSIEGMKMVPAAIGVLFGGLMATIAILFGVIKEEDLMTLAEEHSISSFNSLKRLKYHILLILFAFFATLFAFFTTAPRWVQKLLEWISISNLELFRFIQIYFILLTLYMTIEVVNVLFFVFEIKFIMLVQKKWDKK